MIGGVLFTLQCEGPPGGAHGASIATVYDEILAYPVWRCNYTAFTANLNINYNKVIPLNTWVQFEARIDKIIKRKVYMVGKLYDGNNHSLIYSTGTGLWIESNHLANINNQHPDNQSINNKHSKL